MKNKTVLPVVMAVLMASSGFSFARDSGERHERERRDQRGSQGQQDERRDARERPSPRAHPGRGRDHFDRNDHARRGAGPNHQFYRGQRLPVEYRHRQYVVNDWRGHHLHAPPRGYHWVQSGGDYLLVAMTTGLIMQILLGD